MICMWNPAKTGIIVDRGNGISAFLESGEEFDELKLAAPDWYPADFSVANVPVTPEMVNDERDRRLDANFEFQGKSYQRDRISLQRITGASTLAGFAIASGAQPGDLRWSNPDQDFGWIASDNSITWMDAQTCFAFGQAAAAVESSLIFSAMKLRGMEPIPQDFKGDDWWK
jgi:hypothetical protein